MVPQEPTRPSTDALTAPSQLRRWDELEILFAPCFARQPTAYAYASGTPAWLYRFTYVVKSQRDKDTEGAVHSMEVPFLFQRLDYMLDDDGHKVPISDEDLQMARAFSFYLANFAKNANPNIEAQALRQWPKFDATRSCLMDFTLPGPTFLQDPRGGIALVEQVASQGLSGRDRGSEATCQ